MKDSTEDRNLQEWYAHIGNNITWYRRKRGMTQEMLADKLGISRSHLAAIEAPNSLRRPSMDLIYYLSEALGVSPDALLKENIAPPSADR